VVVQLFVVACDPTNIQHVPLALGAPIHPYSSGCYPILSWHLHVVSPHDHVIHAEEIHQAASIPHLYDKKIMLS
jgi:hypothetical protein